MFCERSDNKLSNRDKKVSLREERESGDGKKSFEWTKNKIIALSLICAGVLAATVFAVVFTTLELGSVRPIRSTEDEARIVGECGGQAVRYEELRFLVISARDELDGKLGKYESLSDDGKKMYESELRALVLEDIKSNYVILSLCDRYGVDIDSKEIRNYVENSVDTLVKDELGGGKDEYVAWLAENGLTDSLMRFMFKVDYLEALLLERLVSEKNEIKYNDSNLPDFVAYALECDDYVKAIHAYYPKNSEGFDAAEMKALAEEALAQLLNESDAEQRYSLMRSTIGRAPFIPGFSTTGTDFYFTYEQMDDAYENAVFALSDYEVADSVIETEDGYYVIMRVPKVRDEIAKRAYELVEQYQYSVLKRLENSLKSDMHFDGNDYFDSLVLSEIK